MMELYKQVKDFPGYEISNCGRVKTIGRKIRYTHAVTGKEHFRSAETRSLMVYKNKRTGYKFVQLRKNGKPYNKTIHSLVASAFLEANAGKDIINHKDGNKHNNYFENLEWCTNEYNHAHATATGLKSKGEQIGSAKLNEKCIIAIKNLGKAGYSHSQIAKFFEVSRTSVTYILAGKTWRHIKER